LERLGRAGQQGWPSQDQVVGRRQLSHESSSRSRRRFSRCERRSSGLRYCRSSPPLSTLATHSSVPRDRQLSRITPTATTQRDRVSRGGTVEPRQPGEGSRAIREATHRSSPRSSGPRLPEPIAAETPPAKRRQSSARPQKRHGRRPRSATARSACHAIRD